MAIVIRITVHVKTPCLIHINVNTLIIYSRDPILGDQSPLYAIDRVAMGHVIKLGGQTLILIIIDCYALSSMIHYHEY